MKVFVKRFQWTGMIEWGQKSKPPKIPGPKIYLPPHPPTKKKTVKKNFHAEFPSLKNFQKALNDIRWKNKFCCYFVFCCRSMWPGYAVTT